MEQELAQVEQLLKEGKKEEAKAALKEFFAQDLSKEEKGKVYVDLLMTYLKISNDLNRRYLETLNQASKSLDELDQNEEADTTAINEAVARKKIQES